MNVTLPQLNKQRRCNLALTKLTKPRARWLTYLAKASGTIVRSIYDKFTDNGVSVKDFGAIGDGVTPDHEAFYAAIASGHAFYIPDGVYNLKEWRTQTATHNIRIRGSSNCRLVGGEHDLTTNDHHFLSNVEGSIDIRNVEFYGFSSVVYGSPTGIQNRLIFKDNRADYCSGVITSKDDTGGYKRVVVEGNYITNTRYIPFAVRYNKMHDTHITDNVIKGTGGAGQILDSIFNILVGNSTFLGERYRAVVKGNIISNSLNSKAATPQDGENAGIMIHDVEDYVVSDNILTNITGGAGEGIYTRLESQKGVISNNTVTDTINGISPKGAQVVVTGNRVVSDNIIDQADQGIAQIESNTCLVSGNYISGFNIGIRNYNNNPANTDVHSKITVTGNSINNVRRAGIVVFDRKRSVTIEGNTVRDVVGGASSTYETSQGFLLTDQNTGILYRTNSSSGKNVVVKGNTIVNVATDANGHVGTAVAFDSAAGTFGGLYVEGNFVDSVQHLCSFNSTETTLAYVQRNSLGYISGDYYKNYSTPFSGSSLLQASAFGLQLATGNRTTDKNTLDVYEEGNWTPSMVRLGTPGTYTPDAVDGATYTRVGNVVYFSGRCAGTNTTGAGGSWVIEGLPFPCVNNSKQGRVICNLYDETATTPMFARSHENNTYLFVGTLVSGNSYYFSGHYYTDLQ